MIHNHSSRLIALLDRLAARHLAIAAIVMSVVFALGYWQLSDHSSTNGLIGPEDKQPISILDAFYFSITTETTLGLGDIRPVGLSRFLACFQVLLGLLLAGVTIAKITSLTGRELRLVSQNASGHWIESVKIPNGPILITFASISFNGTIIRYDGENFTQEGMPCGFFQGEMIEATDTFLRFHYSNRDSNTEFFDDGIAVLHFTSDPRTGRWLRYHATSHDFGKRWIVNYEGFRASDEESAIIHGIDLVARQEFVRLCVSKLVTTQSPYKMED